MNTTDSTPQGAASPCCGKLKSTALWALVVLNVALALVLVNRRTPENRANAAAANVAASEILAVPGSLPGFSNGVVFLIDSSTEQLTAVSYDGPQNKMTWLPQPIDIKAIVNKAAGIRGR